MGYQKISSHTSVYTHILLIRSDLVFLHFHSVCISATISMSTPSEVPDTSVAPPISMSRPTPAGPSASSSVPVPGAHARQRGNLNMSLYPQLFDIIIKFSPYHNLIALRGVCRTFREKCDARLSQHLVIQQQQHPDPNLPRALVPATIRTPCGRAPLFRALDAAVLRESGAPPPPM